MNSSTLSPLIIDRLLRPVIEISQQASGLILDVYRTDFPVEEKSDSSPLTAADMASHRTICNSLLELTPDIPILSEESSDIPWQERKKWHTYWLVDPLDGTREFVRKNGEFTINIALIENHRPVLGVVYIPVSGTAYFAGKNCGASKLIPGKGEIPLQTRTVPDERFVVAGSRSHSTERQQRLFRSLEKKAEIIVAGSSLKFCLVAEGKVDLYPRFGPTSEWDTAAAQCIVEQAGGIVTDLQFRTLSYNTKSSLLNPDFLVIGDSSYDWRSCLETCNS